MEQSRKGLLTELDASALEGYIERFTECLGVLEGTDFPHHGGIGQIYNFLSGLELSVESGYTHSVKIDVDHSGFPTLFTVSNMFKNQGRAEDEIKKLSEGLGVRVKMQSKRFPRKIAINKPQESDTVAVTNNALQKLAATMVREAIYSVPVDMEVSEESIAKYFHEEQKAVRIGNYFAELSELELPGDSDLESTKSFEFHATRKKFSEYGVQMEGIFTPKMPAADGFPGNHYKLYRIVLYAKNKKSGPITKERMTQDFQRELDHLYGVTPHDMMAGLQKIKHISPKAVECIEIGPFYDGAIRKGWNMEDMDLALGPKDFMLRARKTTVLREEVEEKYVFGGTFRGTKFELCAPVVENYFVASQGCYAAFKDNISAITKKKKEHFPGAIVKNHIHCVEVTP